MLIDIIARLRSAMIILVVICCCYVNCICQAQTISYDMITNQTTGSLSCVEDGNIVLFELKNINPFVYDVELNSRLYTLFSTVPDIFKQSTASSSGSAASGGPASGSSAAEAFTTEAWKDPVTFLHLNGIANIKAIESMASSVLPDRTYKEFIDTLNAAVLNLTTLAAVISDANNYLSHPFISKRGAVDSLNHLITISLKISPSRDGLRNIGETNLHEVKNSFNAYKLQVKSVIDLFELALNALDGKNADTIKLQKKLLQLYIDTYKQQLISAEELFDKYVSDKPVERFDKLGEIYNLVISSDFSVRTFVQAEKDYISFTFSMKPHTTTLFGFPLTVGALPANTIRIPVCGGLQISFSTGVFFSDLVHHTYRLLDTTIIKIYDTSAGKPPRRDTVAGKLIVRNELDFASFGPGGLLHVAWKGLFNQHWVTPSLSFGLFTNNYSNVVYVVGIGTIFNAFNSRFSISGGGAFSKVKRLVTGLADRQVVEASTLGTTNSTVTDDLYRHGWFAAFTWNLP
ncbi:MAG: hypothetical protein ABIQ57_07870 [Candidatus Kapaibacterium sp.]